MKKAYIPYIALAVLFGVLVSSTIAYTCTQARVGQVIHQSPDALQEGYMLIAPYRIDILPTDTERTGMVHLVDRSGVVVHTWKTEAPVLVANLQKDGTLFVSMTPAIDHTKYPGFGTTGIIQQLDWNSNVLWEHKDPLMTIDFEVLPDGSVAYLRFEETSPQFASAVRGGYTTATTSVWANDIVVVNREDNTTFAWHLSEHLEPYNYIINSLAPRQEFAHSNSLRYVSDNPITKRPVFVLSVRHISKVFLIDGETGEIVWESPEGLFSMQHDAQLLPNGNLLAFDNGFGREDITGLFSRAIEINLLTGETVWTYDGGTSVTGKAQFASSIMGGAERLSNGNTFITLSTSGRVLEVTNEGEVVWEYQHTARQADGELPILFRARLYEAGDAQWLKKIAWPSFFPKLFCSAGV